jgi:hypothetical protein
MDHKSPSYAVLIVCGLLVVLAKYWLRFFKSKVRNPPSLRGFPFIGNLFSLPPGLDHLAYLEVGRRLKSKIS